MAKPKETCDFEFNADDDEYMCIPYIWEHAMKGEESNAYERIDFHGKVYIYNPKTKEYLGTWDQEKNNIDKSQPNPAE
jgi:hypothetical protein